MRTHDDRSDRLGELFLLLLQGGSALGGRDARIHRVGCHHEHICVVDRRDRSGCVVEIQHLLRLLALLFQLLGGDPLNGNVLAADLQIQKRQRTGKVAQRIPQVCRIIAEGFQRGSHIAAGIAGIAAQQAEILIQRRKSLGQSRKIFGNGLQGVVHRLQIFRYVVHGRLHVLQIRCCRLQVFAQRIDVIQHRIALFVQACFFVGKDGPSFVQLVQSVCGLPQAARHAGKGIQQRIDAAVELMIVVFQLILLVGEIGDLVQGAQIGRHHQQGKSGEGKVFRSDLDREMFLFAGQTQEEDRPQVADQLHLCAGSIQGKDVVLVEQAHHFQGVIVLCIFRSGLAGQRIHVDLHHAGLAGQILRLDGNTVQFIADGDRPGKVFEGFLRFSFKVEVVRVIRPEAEHVGAVLFRGSLAVRQIVDGLVFPIIPDGIHAVADVALHHTGVFQIAVVIQIYVICFIVSGINAVSDLFGKGRRAVCQDKRSRQCSCRQSLSFLHDRLHFYFLVHCLLVQVLLFQTLSIIINWC